MSTTGDNETVFVSRRVKKRYHSSAECTHLQRAVGVREVPLKMARWGLEECRDCRGDVDRTSQGNTHYRALLEAADDD